MLHSFYLIHQIFEWKCNLVDTLPNELVIILNQVLNVSTEEIRKALVDTFTPSELRQHPLSADARKFQKGHFEEDNIVSYLFCPSLVSRAPGSGYLMMFCPDSDSLGFPRSCSFCAHQLPPVSWCQHSTLIWATHKYCANTISDFISFYFNTKAKESLIEPRDSYIQIRSCSGMRLELWFQWMCWHRSWYWDHDGRKPRRRMSQAEETIIWSFLPQHNWSPGCSFCPVSLSLTLSTPGGSCSGVASLGTLLGGLIIILIAPHTSNDLSHLRISASPHLRILDKGLSKVLACVLNNTSAGIPWILISRIQIDIWCFHIVIMVILNN